MDPPLPVRRCSDHLLVPVHELCHLAKNEPAVESAVMVAAAVASDLPRHLSIAATRYVTAHRLETAAYSAGIVQPMALTPAHTHT